jgi:hypothetical protein
MKVNNVAKLAVAHAVAGLSYAVNGKVQQKLEVLIARNIRLIGREVEQGWANRLAEVYVRIPSAQLDQFGMVLDFLPSQPLNDEIEPVSTEPPAAETPKSEPEVKSSKKKGKTVEVGDVSPAETEAAKS